MRFIRLRRWTFILPALSLSFALYAWLYTPFNMSSTIEIALKRPIGSNVSLAPETHNLFFPPPVARVSYILNFPAYVVASKAYSAARHVEYHFLGWKTEPSRVFLLEDRGRDRWYQYSIDVHSVAFFVFVLLLWAWVGSKVDSSLRMRTENGQQLAMTPLRGIRILEMTVILGLSALLIWESVRVITPANCTQPDRQIYSLGLLWPFGMLVYLGFSITHRLGRNRPGMPARVEPHG